MQGQRLLRVNDLLRRVLASLIEERLRDPRLGFVTVTGVETSPDLRHARVYVSVLGSEDAREASLAVLNGARGFLRAEMRREVDLRVLPELAFVFDSTLEYADRIDRLLRETRPAGGETGTPEETPPGEPPGEPQREDE